MTEPLAYSETEERIFEAALQAFARKGKDGARMQEIADAAGINKALLHYYFRSKDKLYEAVFAFVFRRFMLTIGESIRDAETFEQTLHAFIDGYIDSIKDNLDVVRLMVNENLSGGHVMGGRLKETMFSMELAPPRLFIEKLTEAIAGGEVRPVDPRQTLLSVLSCCIFFFITLPTVCMMNPDARDNLDAFIEQRKAHIFDLVYGGLKPR